MIHRDSCVVIQAATDAGLEKVPRADVGDPDAAVRGAGATLPSWQATVPGEPARRLHRLADGVTDA
jgi:acyl-CoA reductase-like NAD-dependent aldehyde dehydrogenase